MLTDLLYTLKINNKVGRNFWEYVILYMLKHFSIGIQFHRKTTFNVSQKTTLANCLRELVGHAVGNCFLKSECFDFLIENIRDLVSIKTYST